MLGKIQQLKHSRILEMKYSLNNNERDYDDNSHGLGNARHRCGYC